MLAGNGEYKKCVVNSNCQVGEFLYDDDYVPIAGATCTLSTRDVGGSLWLNSVAMTGTADGWYSYAVGTSGKEEGLYRGQMCCTSGAEYMCLDKTFEIAKGVGEAVWSYENRNLTSFGTLVADVWNYSDRSLSTFTSLVSSIWGSNDRSLTTASIGSSGELATRTFVQGVGDSLAMDIGTSLLSINNKVDLLTTQVGTINTNVATILTKWGASSMSDVLSAVSGVQGTVGSISDACGVNDTVMGNIQCIQDKWGARTATELYNAANGALTTANSIRSELAYNGKSTTAYEDLQSLKNYVDSLETLLGNSSDSSATATVFGRLKLNKETIENISTASVDLSSLLAKWGTLDASSIYDKVKDLSGQVTEINTVSDVDEILNGVKANSTDLKDLKNQVLALKALLQVNRIQLEKITSKPIVQTWLEEGSIIFKTLITNPSTVTKQTVPFKYYLPKETKKDDVIKMDADLKIEYDSTVEAYYFTGEFELPPRGTKIVSIEVKDVWQISPDKVASVRKQVEELVKPLQKTSYYAQGVTLKTDVETSLDKIESRQKEGGLPDVRIKAYRESEIEMAGVDKKVDSLKSLVTMAGSTGTMFGFIGGVQVVAVWGLIIVLVSGFVFLALYMKTIVGSQPITKIETKDTVKSPAQKNSNKQIISLGLMVMLGLGVGSAGGLWLNGLNKKTGVVLSARTGPIESTTIPTKIPVPTESVELPEPTEILVTPTIILLPTITTSPKLAPSTIPTKGSSLIVPKNDELYVYQAPEISSKVVAKVKENQSIELLTETLKWVKILIPKLKIEGWVSQEFVKR